MAIEYDTDNRIIKIVPEMKTRHFASHCELLCSVTLKGNMSANGDCYHVTHSKDAPCDKIHTFQFLFISPIPKQNILVISPPEFIETFYSEYIDII